MSDQVKGKGGAAWPWPVANPTLGVTAEEIKVQKTVLGHDPTVQPIPELRATEFLNPTTSSEHLRISPPVVVNPMATATGPVHDHFKVRSALEKSRGTAAQEIHKYLQSAAATALPEDRKAKMDITMARAKALWVLMGSFSELQEEIYSKVIGSAPA